MNLFDLDLGDLRAFLMVAETGSFARAARRMEQSKAVVSRRVARLEGQLSALLLQRTSSGALLTESGQTFYEETQAGLSQLQFATESLSDSITEIAGNVRVTVPIYFGAHYLSGLFCDFMHAYPGVDLEVHLSDEKVDLVRSGFDLAVRTGHLRDSSLVHRSLATYRRALVASPDYVASHPAITSPQDLQDHRILHYNTLVPQELWRYHVGDVTHQFAVTPYLRSNSGTVLMSAVTAGLGLTVLPVYITGHYVASGKAVEVLADIDWGITPVT
ncbi:MAG: LysR family transcriptional regulator, partial [Asticcacaulis sp.]